MIATSHFKDFMAAEEPGRSLSASARDGFGVSVPFWGMIQCVATR